MSAYQSLAEAYDGLTYDVDYGAVADFAELLLKNMGKSPKSVLDLACGTGSLSVLFAERGYEVIGADISPEMLTMAWDKIQDMEEHRPLFVCQPMEELELPYGVDFTICCLDSINYLTDPSACQETFRRVFHHLNEGGVFLFDINSVEKLKGLDGQVFLDETENSYCVWRAEFEKEQNICYYGMDIFAKDGDVWRRSFEEHAEYAYSVPQLISFLENSGFTNISVYGDKRCTPPESGEQRIYFTATKE